MSENFQLMQSFVHVHGCFYRNIWKTFCISYIKQMCFSHFWKHGQTTQFCGVVSLLHFGGVYHIHHTERCICLFSSSRSFSVNRLHTSHLGVTFGLCVPRGLVNFVAFWKREVCGPAFTVELDKKILQRVHLNKAWVWLFGNVCPWLG